MEHAVSLSYAYQLMTDDLFWMAGRMYRVDRTQENADGTWTILFFDNQSSIEDIMRMCVKRNTPFEIQH